MDVLLHAVGRNLNRAYRTCAAFGIARLYLHDCEAQLSGALFGATGRVRVETVTSWPLPHGVLALEVGRGLPLAEVDWTSVQTLLVGGESCTLPARLAVQWWAHIPIVGRPGLTVEGTLAIALYAWTLACRWS